MNYLQIWIIGKFLSDNQSVGMSCTIHKLLEVISFCDLNLQKKSAPKRKLQRFVPDKKGTEYQLTDLIKYMKK